MKNKHEQQLKLIGLRISYYRKLRGLTQLQIAEKLEISRTHYSNIEAQNVKTSISLPLLLDIADVLSISPDLLLKFDDIETK